MKKNVASQVVGCQLISKTDGSAVTSGTTTVYVTGDGGTQAAGSVGSGACTHEGNGYWTYAPAQAETNYDQVAFTFVNTNACNVTVQIYPSFPQTGDSYAIVNSGTHGNAALKTLIDAVDDFVDTEMATVVSAVAAIEADTQDIQSRLPAALVSGRMDSSIGAMAANTLTASAVAADAVTEIQAGLSTLDATGVRSAVGLASANLDAQLAAIAAYVDTEVAAILAAVDTEVAAIKAKTDSLTFTVAGQVDANIQYVNDVAITGDGQTGTEWGPA